MADALRLRTEREDPTEPTFWEVTVGRDGSARQVQGTGRRPELLPPEGRGQEGAPPSRGGG